MNLRPVHLLTDALLIRRPTQTPDGQGGFTQVMVDVATVPGRVAITTGQSAHIDPSTGRILSLTTATGWLDQDGLPDTLAASLIGTDIRFTATTPGPLGNRISVQMVVPVGSGPLTITTVGLKVTITLAATSGTPTSTAAQVVDAVNLDPAASALVTASLRLMAYGPNVQAAMATTKLGGGSTFGLPDDGDLIVTPDGEVWSVVNSGVENRLVQVQLVGKTS